MNAIQKQMLKRLEQVKPGATMCPGMLARECGTKLAEARPDLLALAQAKKIVLSQGGKPVAGGEIKGPFRVRLR